MAYLPDRIVARRWVERAGLAAIVISKMGRRRRGVKTPVGLEQREGERAVDQRRAMRTGGRWA
jgi:hypothetical protein